MIDRTDKAIKILNSSGVSVITKTIDNFGGALLNTDQGHYFVKNDTRPWFYPPNVSFKGWGIAVSATSFRKYIQPHDAHFIYSYGNEEKMYFVEGYKFARDAETVVQTDGTEAYVYPFFKAQRFDELIDKKLPVEQKTLDLDDYL